MVKGNTNWNKQQKTKNKTKNKDVRLSVGGNIEMHANGDAAR